MLYSCNIVGCGSLAQVIAPLFAQHGMIDLCGIYNRNISKAEKLQQRCNTGAVIHRLADLPRAEITLLCVSDDAIGLVSRELDALQQFHDSDMIVHFSGALPASAIDTHSGQKLSVHPLRSFANTEHTLAHFKGTYCAIEGDTAAYRVIEAIFSDLGCHTYSIDAAGKALYHTGNVFASNFLVGLIHNALECYKLAGIHTDVARKMIKPITEEVLQNLLQSGPEQALTGPIARGDSMTISKHLDAIEQRSQHLKPLYTAASLACLSVVESKLDTEMVNTIKEKLKA